MNEPRKAPVVLSQEEVARLLQAAPGLKYKAALSVAYGGPARIRGREPEGVRHRRIKSGDTTALYTRVAVNTIRDVKSPLERLGLNLTKRPRPA